MNYGYIRVSSQAQSLERQRAAMSHIELDFTFEEKASGIKFDRPQLQKMLRVLKDGDAVYVSELSRLSRSLADLLRISRMIQDKGATLVSLKENIDLSTSTGRLIFNIWGSINEFERECIRERQSEGIAVKRAQRLESGKPMWGAKKQYGLDQDVCDKVFLSYMLGELTSKQACEELDMKLTTFSYRYHKWADANGYELEDQRGHRRK